MRPNKYEDLDAILTEIFANKEDIDIEVYDEAEKLKLSDKVVTKLVNSIYKRIDKDYKVVDRTRGDFTRFKDYKELGRAINFLKQESKTKNSAELERRADVLMESYKMIVNHKDVFTMAYEVGNDVIIMVYNAIGVGIIKGTSEAISMSVNMNGDYKFGNREYKSSTIDSLQELNKMATSGKIRRMCDNLVSRKEEVTMALGMGVVAVVIFILKNVKNIVYNYYASRVKMADHIRNIQDYVAVKADRTMDTSVRKKQDKWIERLGNLADKIDIDARQSEAAAKKSIDASNAQLDDVPSDWLF